MSISVPTENDSSAALRLDNPGKKCTKNGSGHTKINKIIDTHVGPFNILEVIITRISNAGVATPTPRETKTRFITAALSPIAKTPANYKPAL